MLGALSAPMKINFLVCAEAGDTTSAAAISAAASTK